MAAAGSEKGKQTTLHYATTLQTTNPVDVPPHHYIYTILCIYKGQEILEKISKTKEEGGLGLINLTERIQAIKILELHNAANQRPESDNIIYEIGIKQMAIYGTNYVGSKAEETNDIIKLLEKNIDEINKFRIRHKTTKPKDIPKIFFPKDKKTYFTQIYDAIESKLISTKLPHVTWPAILQE